MSVYAVCGACRTALLTMVMGLRDEPFFGAEWEEPCTLCFDAAWGASTDEKEWPTIWVQPLGRVNRATCAVQFLGTVADAIDLVLAYDNGEF